MNSFSFFMNVAGINTESGGYADGLFEAGCDDALVCVVDGKLRLDFDRMAESYEDAILSAKRDIAKIGGEVVEVGPLD